MGSITQPSVYRPFKKVVLMIQPLYLSIYEELLLVGPSLSSNGENPFPGKKKICQISPRNAHYTHEGDVFSAHQT